MTRQIGNFIDTLHNQQESYFLYIFDGLAVTAVSLTEIWHWATTGLEVSHLAGSESSPDCDQLFPQHV